MCKMLSPSRHNPLVSLLTQVVSAQRFGRSVAVQLLRFLPCVTSPSSGFLRMRFAMWSALLAVLSLSVLTGCGGSSSSSSGSAPTLQSITVSGGASSVSIGGTAQFTATGNYSDGTTHVIASGLTWSSSAPSIVTVDAKGLATGIAAGVATITATKSSVTGSASLGVNDALVSIAVSGASSLAYQQSVQFTATGTYQTGPPQDLTSSVTW